MQSTTLLERDEPVVITRERARSGLGRWFFTAAIAVNLAALAAVAIVLRTYALANIPGINGDEAWSGVQAMRLLRGEGVAWQTPTGNPVNPFFLLPLAALHAIWEPSFGLLRVVPLVSGLLALAVNYWLCRRAFDATTALVSTCLLAVLPIDVAYSRFAWDASQTLLATVLVLYLPILYARKTAGHGFISVAGLIALGAAVVVHPTNLFAAPLVIVPALYSRRKEVGVWLRETSVPAKSWTMAALVAASGFLAYWALRAISSHALVLHGPAEAGEFALGYLRLFSGTTVYQFISGTGALEPGTAWLDCLPTACDVALAALVAWSAGGVARRLAARGGEQDAALVLSWLVMLLGFFVVAGPKAVSPHFERYAICLIAPAVLVMSRGLAWWLESSQRRRWIAAAMAVAVWFWPVSFYYGYFDLIEQTGGLSHLTFHTAAVEPKLQAFRLITEEAPTTQRTTIVCRDWWNYWPIAYLATARPGVEVLTAQEWNAQERPPEPAAAGRTWFVEFAGTLGDVETHRRLQSFGGSYRATTIDDYGHNELLRVYQAPENFSQNY